MATLIVLIFEVRGNTLVAQAANRQSVAARIEERTVAVATSPQLVELITLASRPGAIEVGSAEEQQLFWLYTSLMTAIEEAYLQYVEGNLSQEFFEGRARRALTNLINPVGLRFFEQVSELGAYDPGYMRWIRETYDIHMSAN